MSSQAVLITGHERPDKEVSSHDWEALAKMGTLSVVMGAKSLPEIAEALIAHGKPPETPAALIQWGCTPRQKVAAAPLRDLPEKALAEGLGPPAVLVVGEVANLREDLRWFEKKPLFGKRVLVTRTRSQASQLSRLLRDMGAEAIERPLIEIRPLAPGKALSGAFEGLARYSWLILTSPNGADIFLKALFSSGRDARALSPLKIAAIGPGTADALRKLGLNPDLIPERFVAEGLLEAFERLKEPSPGACLLPRAQTARDALPEGLRALGYGVDVVPVYKTAPASWASRGGVAPLLASPPHLATLTSSSTAEALAALVEPKDRRLLPIASIGPVTSKTARALGFSVAVESEPSTIEALAKAAADYLSQKAPL
jgi:uroporphyrinogen III methyltransferase/synthase